MKRIIGFVLIAVLGLSCRWAYAQQYEYPTADTAAYPRKMTGEELVKLMLIETRDTLRIDSTRFTSEVSIPEGSHIQRPIILVRCLFDQEVISSFVKYDSAFTCARCWFSGNADFGVSTFSDYAFFRVSTFSGDADFGKSTFSSYAKFRRSTFSGNAYFRGSTFSGIANFALTQWYCVVRDSVQPMPGRADFTDTRWANELHMENMDTRPGVTLDFTGAKWITIPIAEYAAPRPVLYLEGADYDKLLFPIADEGIPRPLLGFGNSDSAAFQKGWRLQVPDPEWTEWSVIQRTYGKFLAFLKESGRYDDYDALFLEYHDLETWFRWYELRHSPGPLTFSHRAVVWLFNAAMGLICGYGIRPIRAFWFSFGVILVSAIIYWIFRRFIRPRYETDRENAFCAPYYFHRSESPPPKFRMPDNFLGYNFSKTHLWPKSLSQTKKALQFITWRVFLILYGAWLLFWYLMNFVLFSVNTFCTVGYDNNYPVKGLRYVCMAELVLGYITLTLFLVSLVNVLIR